MDFSPANIISRIFNKTPNKKKKKKPKIEEVFWDFFQQILKICKNEIIS